MINKTFPDFGSVVARSIGLNLKLLIKLYQIKIVINLKKELRVKMISCEHSEDGLFSLYKPILGSIVTSHVTCNPSYSKPPISLLSLLSLPSSLLHYT